MAKKGLITSLILGAVLTLSMGIFTLVTAIVQANTPTNNSYAFAYTSDQSISELAAYKNNDSLKFEYAEGQENFLIADSENVYTVDAEKEFFQTAKAGESFSVKATVTTDEKGSTATYNFTIYKQGTGASEDDQYYIANTEGLVKLEEAMDNYTETSLQVGQLLSDDVERNGWVSIVEDINLSGKDWKGLAKNSSRAFNDTINGNGHAIKNMNIHITAENYQEYISTLADDAGEPYSLLNIGFIRKTDGAVISGLSVVDATITLDSSVLDLINPESDEVRFEAIRVGLVVGYARNTTIDGEYFTTSTKTETIVGEDGQETTQEVEVKESHRSTISGTINGYSYGVGGLGGVAGAMQNSDLSDKESRVSNFNITLNAGNTSLTKKSTRVGGVVGAIYSIGSDYRTTVSDIDVTLTSEVVYRNKNWFGGVAASAQYFDMSNVGTKVTFVDKLTTPKVYAQWLESDDFNDDDVTYLAGVIAVAREGVISNVNSNVFMDAYCKSSGGFVYAGKCELTNVTTSGKIYGDRVSGLARELVSSNLTYTAEADAQLVAADVDLSGWSSAGLVNKAKDSNITATGDVLVNVYIVGRGDVAQTNRQNTMYSAGLVGYFFSSGEFDGTEYQLSGFNVKFTAEKVIDAAGLVVYLGNDDTMASAETKNVSIRNCLVDADITSRSSNQNSGTHKVGGAVAVIYGVAELDNVNVDVNFNQNRISGNKYGSAMFGGLVARVGGYYTTINNCHTTGDAYINYTTYVVAFTYGDKTYDYTQILAGGLVGLIATYGEIIPVGAHPVVGTNESGRAEDETVDYMQAYNTNDTLTITNNSADVNITIDYVAEKMTRDGYRARSAGSLIGMVLNEYIDEGTLLPFISRLDLSTNTATGTITADKDTFTFVSANGVELSSLGYGKTSEPHEEAKFVGSSFELEDHNEYSGNFIKFPVAA